jgi:osmotically-inducible protein OsmY
MNSATKRAGIAAIAMMALVLAGCMSAHHRSTGQVIDDATITATVKTKLAADTRVKAYQIDVDTHAGVVTLSGNVDDATARAAAIEIARTVDGVQSVNDNLSVKG